VNEIFYETKLGKVYHGDCFDYLDKLNYNICITSPPYNMQKSSGFKDAKKYIYDEDLSYLEYEDFIFKFLHIIIKNCKKYTFFNLQRVAGNQKITYKIFGKYMTFIKECLIWIKNNPPPTGMNVDHISNGYEFIYLFAKNDYENRRFKHNNFNGNYVKNYIPTNINSHNKYHEIHKATFHPDIPKYLIKYFTMKTDIIIDPFAGCGETGIQCEQLGRKYILIEKELKYCEIIKERLILENQKRRLFDLD